MLNGFATAAPKAPPKVQAKHALDYVHYREVPEHTPINVLLWQLRRNAERSANPAAEAAAAAKVEPTPAAAPSSAPPPVEQRHCRDYVHYRNPPSQPATTFADLYHALFSKRKGPKNGVSF